MQRIDDEHVRRGRVGVGGRVGQALGGALDLAQRVGQPVRTAADLGAGLVGVILARPADRRLHQHGGDGRQHHHQDDADNAQGIALAGRRRRP